MLVSSPMSPLLTMLSNPVLEGEVNPEAADMLWSSPSTYQYFINAYLLVREEQSLDSATEPGLEPGSIVAQLALWCSALNHCTTQEALGSSLKHYSTVLPSHREEQETPKSTIVSF